MRKIFPYDVISGDVTMEVREVRLDDIALPYTMISAGDRVVALHQVERESWQTARISVRVTAPRHELEAGPWRMTAFVATLAEPKTNTHTAVKLRMEQPGEWVGEVELHRDHHLSRAKLGGHLVATVDDVPGRVIATVADTWTIDLLAKAPVRRDEIVTRWVNFADDPHLTRYKNDPWMVATTDDEVILALNSGFDGLRTLLTSPRVAERPVREAFAAQIAVNLWGTLFNESLQHIGPDVQWPEGWRGDVLRKMLPIAFPERSSTDALVEVSALLREDPGAGDLPSRVLHSAVVQAGLSRGLGGFIRSLRKNEQDAE